MVMRDIEVGLISLTPYEYNATTKSLVVYDEVEINILVENVTDKYLSLTNTSTPAPKILGDYLC